MISAHGRFNCNLVLQSDLGATGGTKSEIPSVPRHPLPVTNVDESEPVKLPSHIVDPTAAYETNRIGSRLYTPRQVSSQMS